MKHLQTASILLCALAALPDAFAHEARTITDGAGGPVGVTIGFHVEPAFEDSFNAVDVILKSVDVNGCAGKNISAPIDTGAPSAPDLVNLQVDAIYLRESARPGGSAASRINTPPAGILKTRTITNESPLKPVYGTPGTYNSWFRPTHPGTGEASGGAYGFHVYGAINATAKTVACGASTYTLAARQITLDTYFVCGAAGTLTTGAFGCVAAIQPFPGKAEDGYESNSSPRH